MFRHVAEDSSILDIAIPLVYFNYKQEVSGARIDFEMKEVSELSTKLLPIAQQQAGLILATNFQNSIEKFFGVKFNTILSGLNTIHKHPGGSSHQSFSGTDLDKSPKDHGVVYPLATAKGDVPNFAGIMALDSGVNNTAHFEYRLVNGELNKDIKYKQGRCMSITIKPVPTQSGVEKLMGYKRESAFKLNNSHCPEEVSFISKHLVELYRNMNYTPFTKAIVPENVTRKETIKSTYNNFYGSGTINKSLFDEPVTTDKAKLPVFLEEEDINAMKLNELKEYLAELDTYYYGEVFSAEHYKGQVYNNKADLVDDILDMQLNIISEQPLSRKELVEALVKRGFTESRLITKSNKELENLYNY